MAKEPDTSETPTNLDQYKAFDRIEHLYLVVIPKVASFGPVLRDWIAAMHSDICSVDRVNGLLSESFNIKLSLRQGCLLLFLWYVLTLEPLLHKPDALRGGMT